MDFLHTLFTAGAGDTESWAPLVLRLGFGLGLLAHALPKWKTFAQLQGYVALLKWPAPTLFAHLARLAETLGSILLILGLFVKPASAALAVYFVLVMLTAHRGQKFVGGWELAFLYFVAALALWALNNPGAFALEGFVRGY